MVAAMGEPWEKEAKRRLVSSWCYENSQADFRFKLVRFQDSKFRYGRPLQVKGANMATNREDGIVIYTMTIRRNGKVYRRPNGRPFRIVIRKKR